MNAHKDLSIAISSKVDKNYVKIFRHVKNRHKKHMMQKLTQLAIFTGFNESNVKTAVKTTMKQSSNFDITINDNPMKRDGLVDQQPYLHGCDDKDLTIYSLTIKGTLVNAKDLLKLETPLGVQIDLLPQSA